MLGECSKYTTNILQLIFLGIMEDLEDMRQEEEEKRKKMMMKKKRKLH